MSLRHISPLPRVSTRKKSGIFPGWFSEFLRHIGIGEKKKTRKRKGRANVLKKITIDQKKGNKRKVVKRKVPALF